MEIRCVNIDDLFLLRYELCLSTKFLVFECALHMIAFEANEAKKIVILSIAAGSKWKFNQDVRANLAILRLNEARWGFEISNLYQSLRMLRFTMRNSP